MRELHFGQNMGETARQEGRAIKRFLGI